MRFRFGTIRLNIVCRKIVIMPLSSTSWFHSARDIAWAQCSS